MTNQTVATPHVFGSIDLPALVRIVKYTSEDVAELLDAACLFVIADGSEVDPVELAEARATIDRIAGRVWDALEK